MHQLNKTDSPAGSGNPLKVAREKLEQAEAFRRQGKLDQAENICTKLLSQYPDYFGALHTLGLVYADKKQSAQALGPLFHAVTLNPRSWITLTTLSGVCLNLRAGEMAAQILEQAMALKPKDPNVLTTLGYVYTQEREYEKARDAFDNALKQQPKLLEASMGLARSLISLGHDQAAAKVLDNLLVQGVNTPDLLSTITQLPKGAVKVDLSAKLGNLDTRSIGNNAHSDAIIAFVRAHALDWEGRYDEAYKQFEIANRKYSEKLKEKRSDEQEREKYSLKWLEEAKPPKLLSSVNSAISLFILGPSRSGKTSLERLVSTLDGVKRGFESTGPENAINRTFQDAGLIKSWSLKHMPPQFYSQFKANFEEELNRRAGQPRVFTNTHPAYILNAGEFTALVPNVRFLFVKRNVADLTVRIFMRSYQSGNAYAYRIESIREHITWYHKMMDVMVNKYPDIVRIVNYEDMIDDPMHVRDEAARLCNVPNLRKEAIRIPDDRGYANNYIKFIKQ
jgi:tetratricopeptide (TPR) repeat protein